MRTELIAAILALVLILGCTQASSKPSAPEDKTWTGGDGGTGQGQADGGSGTDTGSQMSQDEFSELDSFDSADISVQDPGADLPDFSMESQP